MIRYWFKVGLFFAKFDARVTTLLLQLQQPLHRNVLLLLHYEFALLDERPGNNSAFRDVQDEEFENLLQGLDQVVQVVPEFVYEERLYDLVVEQNSLRETRRRGDLGWLDYWKLVLKSHVHFSVLVLEGAHNVLTSYDQVHDACYQLSLRETFRLSAQCYDVYKLHESQEFLMALLRTLKELQLELLLQVAERFINVLVPPIHEPRCPHVRSLELVEVPP